ncbi:MAG: hypothetical protein E6G00_01420 [Actinobacteria bacterium]|nr:MAG: hypothetical protein E6G00_01420 [Actinomycetota bacterium]
MPQGADTVQSSECRQCCAFCDRVVLPSGCIESRCPYLYLYDDETSGRRYMGCLNKVFKVEIDVDLFREAERTRHGYGGVKLTGTPTERCRTTVERAYWGGGDAFECVNPGFFDDPGAGAAAGDFDLRDRL